MHANGSEVGTVIADQRCGCRFRQDTLAKKNKGKCGYASVSDVASGAPIFPMRRAASA